MEALILRGEAPVGYGYGDGSGSGYGSGYGYGDGDGSGYGSGYGYGDGSGYGSGYGSGDGDGYSKALIRSQNNSRIKELESSGATLALWRSDKNGKPANGGSKTIAKPGLVEELQGPLQPCTSQALHATLHPWKWKGDRLWIVALYPPVVEDSDKLASLKREIICEIPNPFQGIS